MGIATDERHTTKLPQKGIAELFDAGVPAVSKHLKNIFAVGELQRGSGYFQNGNHLPAWGY